MYKNITFLFFILINCLIISEAFGGVITLSAKINEPAESFIGFSYKKTKNAPKSSYFRIDLNASNEAKFELNIDGTTFIEVHHGSQKVFLYLEEGNDLNFFFDGNNLFGTLRFDGNGAANNNAWAQYRQQFRAYQQSSYEGGYLTFEADQSTANQAQGQTILAYASLIDQQQEQQLQFLNQQKAKITPALFTFLKTEIDYTNATNRVVWFMEHRYEDLQRSKSAMDVLKAVSLLESNKITHPAYQNFLKAYLLYLYLPEDLSRYKVQYPLYELTNQHFTGKVKYFLQKELLVESYNRSVDAAFGQKHFSVFSNENPYEKYTNQVLATYGGVLSGIESVLAPDFDMVDANRNLIALGDYKGKVVYLSFWASWCKPCIEGFKKSASTRQQLQDMGVVLLNVSIDKKESAWREAMVRHNPIGINGLVLSLEDISKKYDISSIPLYQIIDKNGKFTYLSTNGQRNILDEFRQLVEK